MEKQETKCYRGVYCTYNCACDCGLNIANDLEGLKRLSKAESTTNTSASTSHSNPVQTEQTMSSSCSDFIENATRREEKNPISSKRQHDLLSMEKHNTKCGRGATLLHSQLHWRMWRQCRRQATVSSLSLSSIASQGCVYNFQRLNLALKICRNRAETESS
jgi:hypothetical protein